MGDNSRTDQSDPVEVLFSVTFGDLVDLKTRQQHSLAIGKDGQVAQWGMSLLDIESNVGIVFNARPEIMQGIRNIVKIAPGQTHSLMLSSNGSLLAWGRYVSYH